MSVSTRKTLVPALAATIALVAPEMALGQTLSSRPASVALTVVVPERASKSLTSVDATIVQRSSATLDVETAVGIANRVASRVEVRLGAGWTTQATRVLVRNASGEFETLASDTSISAALLRAAPGDARSRLTFRLESEGFIPTVSVPVEYRVTIGGGDQLAVWTFPATLEIRGARGAR